MNADREYRWWLATRWRQWRNPPPPVVRAVVANLAVALVGGVLVLAYDLAVSRGNVPSGGGDLRALVVAIYVVAVLVAGSLFTYLWVALPTGATGERRRSGWSAMLGLFTAVPMAYLVLVVALQIVKPLLG